MAVGPGPSYGSSEAGVLLNILIMSCDKPIGLFGVGVVYLADGCVHEVVLGAVVGDVDLADCWPVCVLEKVFGVVVLVVGLD